VVPKERFHGLDGLRGALAVVVFLAHGYTNLVRPYGGGARDFLFYFVVLSSRLAVLGFFAVSGFVIAYSIYQNRQRNGQFVVPEFARSRVARIGPSLLAAIILTWCLALLLLYLGMVNAPAGAMAERDVFWPNGGSQALAILSLGFFGELSGGINGPLWSLAYEIQLYVFAALAAATMQRRSLPLILGVGALTLVAGLRAVPLQIVCYACFAAGAVVFHWRAKATATFMAGLFAISILVMAWADIDNLDRTPLALISQLLFGAGFAVFIVLMTRSRALNTIGWSGDFSYTLYVLHFPIFLFAFYVLHPIRQPWLAFAVLTVCCALLCAIAARWLEDTDRWRALLKRPHRLQSKPIS
jgi:peptidoglycan/LPS O-acetylase OafA/YrhL